MEDREFAERIIRTADEYYFIAEEQWGKAIELEPADEETLYEFRRLIRVALTFYIRSYLVLDLVESDDEQDLEDLLEIIFDQEEEIADFARKNGAAEVLAEESTAEYSRLFAVAEALRTLILQQAGQLAASLPARFMNSANDV